MCSTTRGDDQIRAALATLQKSAEQVRARHGARRKAAALWITPNPRKNSRPHRAFETAPEKPFNKFLDAVERVITNVIDKRTQDRGPATNIRLGDARKLDLPDDSIGLVLTSPPYLNAIDYLRCSKFSLVWMGHKIGDLREVRSESIGTESASELPIEEDAEIHRVISALSLRPKLNVRHERILAKYIHDMRAAVSEVGRVLSKGGSLPWAQTQVMGVGTHVNRGDDSP
jgi:hypothetical protein